MLHYIFIAIAAAFTICYVVLIVMYRKWFLQLKPFVPANNVAPSISFSIIIPARNEAEVIETCLTTILQQNYPQHLFEVIVIDDHSTDETPVIIQKLQQQFSNLKLIDLKKELKGKELNSYKKKAIEIGISKAANEWIVTTDADCFVTNQWLQNFNAFIRHTGDVLVAAPVTFLNNKSLVSVFQTTDFMSLQGITAASVSANMHSMCNGANLAYDKSVFYNVNGFKGIDNIASGDDMLLMHKIKKAHPGKVGYLFNDKSIVSTLPMPTWRTFFNQRVRWASKADAYDDRSIFKVLVLVYLFNAFICALPVIAIWDIFYLALCAIIVLIKAFTELSFMLPVAKFFNNKKLLWWFVFLQPMHIVYTVTAGWLGKFGTYQWKGRTVK